MFLAFQHGVGVVDVPTALTSQPGCMGVAK